MNLKLYSFKLRKGGVYTSPLACESDKKFLKWADSLPDVPRELESVCYIGRFNTSTAVITSVKIKEIKRYDH